MSEGFRRARLTDATVHQILSAGGTLEDCVAELVKQKEALITENIELRSIAPRKMKLGDKVVIWRCPDELVPELK